MKNRRILIIISSIAIVVLLVVGGYFLYKPQTTSPPATPPTSSSQPNTSTSEPSGDNPTQTPSENYNVKVYFSKHPESDDDPSRTFPVNRTTSSAGVGTFAITELLVGPTTTEKNMGYFSMVRVRDSSSNCNDQDFTLKIANGTARLQFCRTFDALGVVSDGQAKQEITDSLRQFSSVNKVIILTPEGHCQFDLSGEDKCLQ